MDDELDWIPVKKPAGFSFAEMVAFATVSLLFGVYVGAMIAAFAIN